jgi:hypothetical protein
MRRLEGESIIVATYVPPLDPVTDVIDADKEVHELAKDIKGIVFQITDTRQTKPTLDVIIEGMAQMRRAVPVDPRFRTIIVGTEEMVKLGAQAAKQAQYGERMMSVFATVEEAIEYARAELAKNPSA